MSMVFALMGTAERSTLHTVLLCAAHLVSIEAASDSIGQSPENIPNLGCGPKICEQGAALREAYTKDVIEWPAVESTNGTAFRDMAPFERPDVD